MPILVIAVLPCLALVGVSSRSNLLRQATIPAIPAYDQRHVRHITRSGTATGSHRPLPPGGDGHAGARPAPARVTSGDECRPRGRTAHDSQRIQCAAPPLRGPEPPDAHERAGPVV